MNDIRHLPAQSCVCVAVLLLFSPKTEITVLFVCQYLESGATSMFPCAVDLCDGRSVNSEMAVKKRTPVLKRKRKERKN